VARSRRLVPGHRPLDGGLLIETEGGPIAVPTQVQTRFPGLVPYVVLRDTEQRDLARLLRRVQASLRAHYREARRWLAEQRARMLIAALIVIALALVVVVVLVILAKAMADVAQPPRQLPEGNPNRDRVPLPDQEREKVPVGAAAGPGRLFLDVRMLGVGDPQDAVTSGSARWSSAGSQWRRPGCSSTRS
jgi:hypothetical protein